jgi:hypothetical protein
MKKIILSLILGAILVALPMSGVFAATTQDVTITATPTFISISNLPISFGFGVVAAGSGNSTGETHFTITNGSTVAIDLSIGCNGWSGTSSWTYGAPGADTAQLKASPGSGGYTITVPNGSTAALLSNVATSTNPQWGLQLQAPTSFSHGAAQTTTVTVSAAQH